jgi:D-cysteine desulfhydrase
MPGAANALANLGYVDAVFELEEQVRRGEMPRPDAIVLPTGSSGTLAALALGLAAIGWDTEVIGVRITALVACNPLTIAAVVRATRRFVQAREPSFSPRAVRYSLFHRAIGKGYGFPTPEAIEGAEQVRALTGARGEVTYSGKALAALKVIANLPRWSNKTLLLWNTLSTPRPTPSRDARSRVPRDLEWMFERDVVA